MNKMMMAPLMQSLSPMGDQAKFDPMVMMMQRQQKSPMQDIIQALIGQAIQKNGG